MVINIVDDGFRSQTSVAFYDLFENFRHNIHLLVLKYGSNFVDRGKLGAFMELTIRAENQSIECLNCGVLFLIH